MPKSLNRVGLLLKIFIMKTKIILATLILLNLFSQLGAQTQGCGNPNPNFCPGNFFQNGNFETVTGDPELWFDQDIDLATGWSKIWQFFDESCEFKRAYKTDFEIYPCEDEVSIYIGIK